MNPYTFIKKKLDKFFLSMESDGQTILLVLLTKDGQITRGGNGSGMADQRIFKGEIDSEYFDALIRSIDEQIFPYANIIDLPEKIGKQQQLTIIFSGEDEIDFSFVVKYGSESGGLPNELAQIVINAVKLTEDWYQKQLAIV